MELDWILQTEPAGFPIAAGLFTVGLAVVHLLVGRWNDPGSALRRRLLSVAGGATVAYVFVLLLPEVSEAALLVAERRDDALLAEQAVYVMALSGFVAFYGVEAIVSRRLGEDVEASSIVFWGHVAVFALYSGLIGYLLFHQEVDGVANLFFYALAMALHFGVTDYGLRRHHGDQFDRVGRWLLVGATLAGGVLGAIVEVDGLALSMLFGFVAGAVILNVVKEELPDVDQSRFAAFVVGAVVYSVVLLLA
jgi:hypothetical protein